MRINNNTVSVNFSKLDCVLQTVFDYYCFVNMKWIVFVLIGCAMLGASCANDKQSKATTKKGEDSNALRSLLRHDMEASGWTFYGDHLKDTNAKGYVVVYAPTLVNKNVFDYKLHLLGMYNYFEKESSPRVETILISNDNKTDFETFMTFAKTNYGDWFDQLTVVHDERDFLVEALSIDTIHLDHAGTAITYNERGVELFRDEEYKCQGEKLLRMHQHFYPKEIDLINNAMAIEVGQKIPESWKSHVNEYLGKKNVLITFYPAPLSHSCSIQMETLGAIGLRYLENKDLKVVAVSIGDAPTVKAWEMHQSTAGLGLMPDTTGKISNDFNSIIKDDFGTIYSARTVFLINKKGEIAYINEDYDVAASLDELEDAIVAL